jgi:hypothetical protein
MATRWLDAARYADTNGYQSDGPRFMWRWRDWVIDAFNANMPFDQFTIEQIAGDLLPNASRDQILATGFNRNHRGNGEGGIIPEEYAVEYVVDRVDTTATVWLGLTMGCARCHDHKYDPLTMRDFYRVFAYFNNIPERGKAFKHGNSPPTIQAPTSGQLEELAEWEQRLGAAQKTCAGLQNERVAAQRKWEAAQQSASPIEWSVSKGMIAHYPLDADASDSSGKNTSGEFKEGAAVFGAGRIGQAAQFDGTGFVDAREAGEFGYFDKFSIGAWIWADEQQGGTILSKMADTDRSKGYSFVLQDGRLHVNLVVRWLDDSVRVRTEKRLQPGRWHHVMMTYTGTRTAEGIQVYVDGESWLLVPLLNDLNQDFRNTEPLRIGSGGGTNGRFHGMIDDVRLYQRALSQQEAALVSVPERIDEIVSLPAGKRTAAQAKKLAAFFIERMAAEPLRRAWKRLETLQDAGSALLESFPTVMVMQERETPRETFVLTRGRCDRPGERVEPGVPDSLPALPSGAPRNRLGFASWLIDQSNPLTARVTVNRFWQRFFGTGLVKTVEDFGSQGELPSHPDLLDWLATEIVRTGWDVKRLAKLIVMSGTYRQSSAVTPEMLTRDPENRLLARGPRQRLSAQTIRDQALFISGLLVERLGGPSVKPYQPAGLWKDLTGGTYKPDSGESLYRRSLYTFWKRTIGPPTMMTFDASPRETCIVRNARTNTPLQALALMNDVTFVEAARALAARVMAETPGDSSSVRVSHAFRSVVARRPSDSELEVLVSGFERHLAEYRQSPPAAAELIRMGESRPNEDLDPVELAAYTIVAGLILNLDEAITKE